MNRLRRRRLVRERDPRSMRQLAVLFALCVGASTLFLFSLWQRVELTRLRYRIMDLRAERDSLAGTQKALRLERSELLSLPRVERLARQRLGLAPATSEQVFTVGDAGDLLAAGTHPSPSRQRRR